MSSVELLITKKPEEPVEFEVTVYEVTIEDVKVGFSATLDTDQDIIIDISLAGQEDEILSLFHEEDIKSYMENNGYTVEAV